MRNSEIEKNVFVKTILSQQQLMQTGEKSSRLSALNDSMVVGAADGDRFADAELRQDCRMDRLILGRELNCAGGDDHRLSSHQSRRRSHGADGAGVGEGNRRALKIRNLQFA